jgi:hypothetical protein
MRDVVNKNLDRFRAFFSSQTPSQITFTSAVLLCPAPSAYGVNVYQLPLEVMSGSASSWLTRVCFEEDGLSVSGYVEGKC